MVENNKPNAYKTNTNFEPWSEKRARLETKKREAQKKALVEENGQEQDQKEEGDDEEDNIVVDISKLRQGD